MINLHTITVRINDEDNSKIAAIKQHYQQTDNIAMSTADVIRKAIRDAYDALEKQ